jgi:hypothetical protein
LNSDIRKLPSDSQARKGRKSPTKPSTPRASSIVDSTDVGGSTTAVSFNEASSLSANLGESSREQRNSLQSSRLKRKPRQVAQKPSTRYWSEYDHPEDGSDEEGYYIYVDPDDTDITLIPFQKQLTSILLKAKNFFSSRKSEPKLRKQSSEFDPLLSATTLPKLPFPSADNDSDSDDASSTTSQSSGPYTHRLHSLYSDIPGVFHYHDPLIPLLISSMSLFFSTVLSLVLLVLNELGRNKAREEIDLITVFVSAISLAFAAAGFYGLVLRDHTGYARWLVAVLVFGLVVIVNAVLWVRLIGDLSRGGWNEREPVGLPPMETQ